MTARRPSFGTDGVRGVANKDLTALFALRLGMAAASVLGRRSEDAHIIVGRDTRISGDMLEAALNAGLAAMGCRVTNVGVVPTPAVSNMVVRLRATAGVVISASHNPYEDNGIKFLGPDGCKLPDDIEEQIEALLDEENSIPMPEGAAIGRIVDAMEGHPSRSGMNGSRAPVLGYIAHVAATAGGPLDGLRLVLDCANGATSPYAPELFADLGAEVVTMNAAPDGVNINRECGSTHPGPMTRKVLEVGADAGLAFDGDGDRVIMCDEKGRIVDGDRILAICATGMKQRGELPGDTVVATIMSNAGLEAYLEEHGILLRRTDVGDRYVAEEMNRCGAVLGGEQSGHVIFSRLTPTGDGMVTGLQVLKEMRYANRPLGELAERMPVYPQILRNVRVADRQAWRHVPQIQERIAAARETLGKSEWVSVRPSGTEPVVRVMAQGQDEQLVRQVVDELCALIASYGGGAS